jgi:hypothetical protein
MKNKTKIKEEIEAIKKKKLEIIKTNEIVKK